MEEVKLRQTTRQLIVGVHSTSKNTSFTTKMQLGGCLRKPANKLRPEEVDCNRKVPRKPTNKLRHEEVNCNRGVTPKTHQHASPRRGRLQPGGTPQTHQHAPLKTNKQASPQRGRLQPWGAPETLPRRSRLRLGTAHTKKSIATAGP